MTASFDGCFIRAMTDTPIFDFLMRSRSFKANDIAFLFALIAAQQGTFDNLISPSVRSRVWCIEDMAPDACSESLDRLIKAGEVEWFEDEKVQGYRVVRLGQLEDLMTEFGRRRYYRVKSTEHRKRKAARSKMI